MRSTVCHDVQNTTDYKHSRAFIYLKVPILWNEVFTTREILISLHEGSFQ